MTLPCRPGDGRVAARARARGRSRRHARGRRARDAPSLLPLSGTTAPRRPLSARLLHDEVQPVVTRAARCPARRAAPPSQASHRAPWSYSRHSRARRRRERPRRRLCSRGGRPREPARHALVRAYHVDRGRRAGVPDPGQRHGTNPATRRSALRGERGSIDDRGLLSATASPPPWTTPSRAHIPTEHARLFEEQIETITAAVHRCALVYIDGANLNAIMASRSPAHGRRRDAVQPDKTFSTPHGGRGPAPVRWGCGPVAEYSRCPVRPAGGRRARLERGGSQERGRLRSFYGTSALGVRMPTSADSAARDSPERRGSRWLTPIPARNGSATCIPGVRDAVAPRVRPLRPGT